MARKFNLATFWRGIRFDELLRLMRAYKLRSSEMMYLRYRIIDEPFSSNLDQRVIIFLDVLIHDVCDYFLKNCPDSPRFESIVTNEERQAKHERIWETIRSEFAPLIESAPKPSVTKNSSVSLS